MLQSKRRSSSSHLNLVCRTAGERVARPCPTQFLPRIRIFSGVCRLIANHLFLTIFESTPEVRVLCSAGITQPRRSYGPVRLPPGPPPIRDVEVATLAHDGSPPITRITFPTCRAQYPGGSSGCACRFLPHSCSLPNWVGWSASALSLSGPAQALLTLRPAGSLSRPRRPLSRGSDLLSCPGKSLVSFRIYRQLSGWNPPPQVIRAFGAHDPKRTSALSERVADPLRCPCP